MNKTFKDLFEGDMQRYAGAKTRIIRLQYFLRKAQTSKPPIQRIYRLLLRREEIKRGIEISYKVTIGPGLYLGHPYGITINDSVVIGRNVNIHKGVTLGRENRGKRIGAPHVGDNVWIGINATIVGNIRIGNNVLIAPNAFVNIDIPDNSIVIGNPCQIISDERATDGYIINTVK